jgi:hypothetical protein
MGESFLRQIECGLQCDEVDASCFSSKQHNTKEVPDVWSNSGRAHLGPGSLTTEVLSVWLKFNLLACRYRIEQELGTEIKPIPPQIDRAIYCR